MTDIRIPTILTSGWRFIPQSYAVVSQAECLEILRRRPAYRLYFEDMPYYDPSWRPVAGLFSAQAEAALREIPPPPADLRADAELRRAAPYDFLRPSRARHTAVYGTSEALTIPSFYVPDGLPLHEAQKRHRFSVVTPSRWSRQGFLRCGIPEEDVVVVPHGFDPAIFHPAAPEERRKIRAEMGISPEDFVFCHAGVMTTNKGIQFLLPAFAKLLEVRPHARLLLKGVDSLYRSNERLQQELGQLDRSAQESVLERLIYSGDALSFAGMARMYQASDCYVSPYVAEGFNLPVLEAIACGLPAICTAGGPTDDFVSEDFALQIESTLQLLVKLDVGGAPEAMGLIPELDHLVHLMLCIVDDAEFRDAAGIAGPAYVRDRFTWERAVDQLLLFLLQDRAA